MRIWQNEDTTNHDNIVTIEDRRHGTHDTSPSPIRFCLPCRLFAFFPRFVPHFSRFFALANIAPKRTTFEFPPLFSQLGLFAIFALFFAHGESEGIPTNVEFRGGSGPNLGVPIPGGWGGGLGWG